MQTSKISLMICVGALSVIPLLARAEDTPEQARLREALHAAMKSTPVPAETEAAAAAPAASEVIPPAVEQPAPAAAAVVEMSPTPPVVVEAALPGETRVIEAMQPAVIEQPLPTNAAAMTETVPEATVEPLVSNNVIEMTGTNAVSMDAARTNAVAEAMKMAEKPLKVRQLTAEDRQQLDSLTARYKADQLSPQEYHEQRAKIIFEP